MLLLGFIVLLLGFIVLLLGFIVLLLGFIVLLLGFIVLLLGFIVLLLGFIVLLFRGIPIHALEMVLVEDGIFLMASDADDQYAPQPIHRVTLDSFYMSKYEVTIEEWRKFVQESGIDFDWERNSRGVSPVAQDSPCERCPILNVSWYQAVQFCNWLSEQEGLTPCYSGSGPETVCDFRANGYRLPTEAEWEYAARGGNKSKGYRFSGSDDVDAVGWYHKNSGERILDRTAQAVGGKAPNEIGLYDMSGNVYEWCWDWYGDFSAEPQENPTGPPSGIGRVTHGGCWESRAFNLQWSYRGVFEPHIRNYVGFRPVRNGK